MIKDPNAFVIASTAGTVGGGLSAVFSTFLGIDTYTIAWALIGGVAGEARVARKTWYLTLLQFFAVCMLAALTATALWVMLGLDNEIVRHGLASFFSFYFYPLTQRLTVRLGSILDTILHRVFGSVEKPSKDDGSSPERKGEDDAIR